MEMASLNRFANRSAIDLVSPSLPPPPNLPQTLSHLGACNTISSTCQRCTVCVCVCALRLRPVLIDSLFTALKNRTFPTLRSRSVGEQYKKGEGGMAKGPLQSASKAI